MNKIAHNTGFSSGEHVIMKTFNLILILLSSYFVYGQNSDIIFFFEGSEFQQWTYQDFIKNDIKKIEDFKKKYNTSD